MSARTKTRTQKIGKFLGIVLFAFLMLFNIKFAVSDNANGDIDLFGLKLNTSFSEAYASSGDDCPGSAVFCKIIYEDTNGDITIIIVDKQFYSV